MMLMKKVFNWMEIYVIFQSNQEKNLVFSEVTLLFYYCFYYLHKDLYKEKQR